MQMKGSVCAINDSKMNKGFSFSQNIKAMNGN